MKNHDVAQVLYRIADLLEMQGVAFKPRAYQNAARAIESLSEDIEDIHEQGKLEDISGVGKGISEKIAEFLTTGKVKHLEELKKSMPFDIDELMSVPGLGPKKIMFLHTALGVKNISDLKKAAEKHAIRELEGFGEKSELEILKGIALSSGKQKRFLWGNLMPLAEEIKAKLAEHSAVKQIEIAGSYRRRKETVGDLDILITSSKPREVMDFFVHMPLVQDILAHGSKKSAVRLTNGLQVDLRVLKEDEYGSALQYFTGSKEHNVALRRLAVSKGLTLNEYGLFTIKDKKLVDGRTENGIYDRLGVDFMPAELRENTGEIELGQKHQLPWLVEYSDILGDFQTQTNWSDGAQSIEEMALAAQKMGLKFITITDHAGPLGIAHALDEKRLLLQAKEIDKLSEKFDITILKGAEIDILKNGRLAISRKAQEQLDVVLGSVHSSFKMPEKEMTARICSALEHDRVHTLAHPTGRIIYRRGPYALDMEKVFETAQRTGTFLEINGYPERTDLNDVHVKRALERGCRFVVSSDAHHVDHLRFLEFGAATARRGWCEAKDILNTFPLDKIKKILAGR